MFDAFGVELEYMLVDRDTLCVRPLADSLLSLLADGLTVSDVELGPITWSNELALHVIELKTTSPSSKFRPLPSRFEAAVRNLRPYLNRLNLRLLPTAMHPWMDPATETRLWPHQNREIYEAYHRIFNCYRHGWANVQSVHLNLPFHGDEQFARLHAAVRLMLPLLPALAASSPVVDANYSGYLDTRMKFYADHCNAAPSLVGDLIPEPIFDEATYREKIFDPIHTEMAPLDAAGDFEVDFLNARGAIARFDRGSIELRVMDVQEYPAADVAICAAVTGVIRTLTEERFSALASQQAISTGQLRSCLDEVAVTAEHTVVNDAEYLRALGVSEARISAGELWSTLIERARIDDPGLSSLAAPLRIIEQQGSLASRIQRALGRSFDQEDLVNVYDQLADCLDQWEPFQP